ncbi:phosphoribosyltransferase family protein [Tumidithrix elongata RA019]|uniref:Phosphoribosyltransferase family protein n=1 Tax=Tumidithrix elongata BACA0141 TaxID=2716417 RepID=A0AAW9Q1J3_9CYAN|nr:phosphoribosyltransferase family protein [Tumidithrix elongata RA019]
MELSQLFQDRQTAGAQLAELIAKEQPVHPIVYGVPRGGLLVAAPVAQRLACPLDVAIAKKITLPHNSELALGAITPDRHILRQDRSEVSNCQEWTDAVQRAHKKACELLQAFQPIRPKLKINGATAILVDDGIATGATIAAIAAEMRMLPYQAIWIAAPVAPIGMSTLLLTRADRIILLAEPRLFGSVSSFYNHFPEVTTFEALSCLRTVNLLSILHNLTDR